jgi:leader peptidase (prepilin peptidase) / N-methyltransferase
VTEAWMIDPWMWVAVAGVFGLLLGSFLNVCVYRWPLDQSVVSPPSHCPSCDERVRAFDNIPVLSWIFLRGRCRHCGNPISIQYPLVELAVGLIWAGVAWRFGADWEAVRGGVFLTLLFGISLTDARFYIIPDQFSLGGLALGLGLAGLSGAITFTQAVLGAVVGFGLLWLVAWGGSLLFKKQMAAAGVDQAMGGGDIKMMAMVGAFLGISGVFLTVFLGSLVGVLIFGPISAMTKRLIPFGIFLAAGAAVAYGWGDALVGWYMTSMLGMPPS